MIESQAQRLKRLREAAGLSQRAVSKALGINQGDYSHWESGHRTIPDSHVRPLADLLGVDPSALTEVRRPRPRGRPSHVDVWPHPVQRTVALPPYEVRGTLDETLALGDVADDALYVARRHLPQPDLARLVKTFPRDSAEEFLAILLVLGLPASLCRLTLARLRCPSLATDAHGSPRSGLHYVRDALVVTRPEISIAMFPQVWVASVLQSEWYRLDFLTLVRRHDGKQCWVDVEIDGQAHENTVDRDKRRTRGIGLPRRGFWVSDVKRPGFAQRMLDTLVLVPDSLPPYARLNK